MSPENPDPPAPTEHPRVFSSTTILGVICFGAGLLVLAVGILLALAFVVTANPLSIVGGVVLALVGIGVNITGLVLLYRGATGSEARNGSRPSRLGRQGGEE